MLTRKLGRWSWGAFALAAAAGIAGTVVHNVSAAPREYRPIVTSSKFIVRYAEIQLQQAEVEQKYAQTVEFETDTMYKTGKAHDLDQLRANRDVQLADLNVQRCKVRLEEAKTSPGAAAQ